MVEDRIEILDLDLFNTLAGPMALVERTQGRTKHGIGWHYYLDFAWLIHSLRRLPPGSLVLDAGAGRGLMQMILVELGHNVISVDFVNRPASRLFKAEYGDIHHYLNDQSKAFYHSYTQRIGQDRAGEPIHPPIDAAFPTSGPETVDFIERYRYRPGQTEGAGGSLGKLFVYQADLQHLDLLPDGLVDAVVSVSALEHNSHDQFRRCAGELLRVTRPGGLLAVTVSAAVDDADWYHEPSKGWCYSEATLRDLLGLPADTPSNYAERAACFGRLREEHNELHKRLAPSYFTSGGNGMPWGRWDPQYLPVGVLRWKNDPRDQ